jgi:hypothetical protein
MNPSLKLRDPLDQVLPALAQRRPIFHSEADFQLALAWEIQSTRPDASIRLEQRVFDSPRINLDILVVLDGLRLALELKYLRAATDVTVDGERFALVVGAPDVDRYDTIKDIVRLERLVDQQLVDAGAVVVLSNSSGFWRPSATGRSTGYDAFRIHDGATLTGTLEWGPTAGAGTRKGREGAHLLAGIYRPSWRPFSTVGARSAAEFRTLTILVPST